MKITYIISVIVYALYTQYYKKTSNRFGSVILKNVSRDTVSYKQYLERVKRRRRFNIRWNDTRLNLSKLLLLCGE